MRSLSVAAAWEKDKNEFELEMIRSETRSAKRKASKYKASMAEMQVHNSSGKHSDLTHTSFLGPQYLIASALH